MRIPWIESWTRSWADSGADDRDGLDGWTRPAPTSRQRRIDVQIGLLLALATVGSAVLGRNVGLYARIGRAGELESTIWCLAVSLPLVVRRRFPLTTLLVVAAAFIGMQSRIVPEQQLSSICLFLALFTAGGWGRDRQAARAVRLGVVLVMFCWITYQFSVVAWSQEDYDGAEGPLPPPVATMIFLTAINILYFVAALGFGTMAWTTARQHALLDRRNAELATEREANAQRAVIAERIRIARELHDVVAHHVSLMGIQAAAARRTLAVDPAQATATLEAVEETGRAALDEMHRLLGVLRSGDAPDDPAMDGTDPVPGIDRLGELVSRTTQAGLPTELTVVGTPAAVSQTISVSAYRVVQEALTNAVKHAAAQRADVRVRHLDGALEVEVVDDGRGLGRSTSGTGMAQAGTGQAGTGMGQAGMRERVAMTGGELELGPRPEGGYRVRARFPLAGRPLSAPSQPPLIAPAVGGSPQQDGAEVAR